MSWFNKRGFKEAPAMGMDTMFVVTDSRGGEA